MKRKEFLKKSLAAGIGLPLAISSCVPRPNEVVEEESIGSPAIIMGKKYKWKMVTTWPPNFHVLGEVANYYADWVKEMSGGRIEIKVYGGGELVPALQVFDAVSSGTAEMGSGAAYYWAGKMPAAPFFCGVPFGMNAQQVTAWLVSGGGYELYKETYAPFNVVPFLAGNTGVQMGGWFNKEINTPDDLKGLKMRLPGLAGKVLEKAGGAAVLYPGGELYTNLDRGVIDATEWIGPFHDYKMGFHKISKYYYYPGWHEPGSQLEFMVNKQAFESLPKDLQAIVEMAAWKAQTFVLSEFEAKNGDYLEKIINESKADFRPFPQEVIEVLRGHTKETLEEIASSDPQARKVYDSYRAFHKKVGGWSEFSEKAYLERILEQK